MTIMFNYWGFQILQHAISVTCCLHRILPPVSPSSSKLPMAKDSPQEASLNSHKRHIPFKRTEPKKKSNLQNAETSKWLACVTVTECQENKTINKRTAHAMIETTPLALLIQKLRLHQGHRYFQACFWQSSVPFNRLYYNYGSSLQPFVLKYSYSIHVKRQTQALQEAARCFQ